MLKFIKNIASFICFAVISVIIILNLWVSFFPSKAHQNLNYRIGAGGHMYTRLQEVENFPAVDILVLGSSQAYRGFDPRHFSGRGLTMFNLGSSSQTPMQTEILVKEYIDHLSPSMVIYVVSGRSFSSDGVESATDIIANSRLNLEGFTGALKTKNLIVCNTLLVKAWRQMFRLDQNFTEPRVKGKDAYISGGFVERELSFYANDQNFPAQQHIFRLDQVTAFESTLTLLENRGIEIIIVHAPIVSGRYNSYTNNDELDHFLKAQGFPYYNLNHSLSFSSTRHFFDSTHLNQVGVDYMNEQFLDILHNEGFIH